LILVALAACRSERLHFPAKDAVTSQKASFIKKGITSKEDVKKILGLPLDRLLFPDGAETWFYKDFNLETIYIEFDAGGMVTKFINND